MTGCSTVDTGNIGALPQNASCRRTPSPSLMRRLWCSLKGTFVLVADSTIMMQQLPEGAPPHLCGGSTDELFGWIAGRFSVSRRSPQRLPAEEWLFNEGHPQLCIVDPTMAACRKLVPKSHREANSTEPLQHSAMTKCFIYLGNASHSLKGHIP